MNNKKWVQHISGQGEKWGIVDLWPNHPHLWRVIDHQNKQHGDGCAWFPKSEYILCDPPEEWEDVTGECEWMNSGSELTATIYHLGHCLTANRGYRFRKVKLAELDGFTREAFIVERKKSW